MSKVQSQRCRVFPVTVCKSRGKLRFPLYVLCRTKQLEVYNELFFMEGSINKTLFRNSRKVCVCTMCVDHQRVHIDGLSRIHVAEILLHLPVMEILLHYVRAIAFTSHFNHALF